MYLRFGEVSIWPHRDIVKENMPEDYRKEFSSTFAIVDGTEIKIQKTQISENTVSDIQ